MTSILLVWAACGCVAWLRFMHRYVRWRGDFVDYLALGPSLAAGPIVLVGQLIYESREAKRRF